MTGELAGKLYFYLKAVDEQLRQDGVNSYRLSSAAVGKLLDSLDFELLAGSAILFQKPRPISSTRSHVATLSDHS